MTTKPTIEDLPALSQAEILLDTSDNRSVSIYLGEGQFARLWFDGEQLQFEGDASLAAKQFIREIGRELCGELKRACEDRVSMSHQIFEYECALEQYRNVLQVGGKLPANDVLNKYNQ
jgi:hypothetical protein